MKVETVQRLGYLGWFVMSLFLVFLLHWAYVGSWT